MSHLLSAANIGRLVILLAVAVVSSWVTRGCTPTPEPPGQVVKTDTVYRERQITYRDTVTETVPREVIRYDTVRVEDRDTIRIEVPIVDTVIADTTARVPWRPFGLIRRHPVRVEGQTFTLSYYQLGGQRWEQRRYEAEVPTWRVTAAGQAIATRSLGVLSADVQVKRRTGPVWVGIGPVGAVSVGSDGYSAGLGGTLTVESTLWTP